MLLIDVYAWATQPDQNATLKRQLAAAIASAAVQVLSEDPVTPNNTNRQLWAKRVLATPTAPLGMADQMIWGCLGNVAIQNELAAPGSHVPDSDLEYCVSTLIDVYSP